MHIFAIVLSAVITAPIAISIVFVGNYFRNRLKGISILDIYWVSGFLSILFSALISFILWVYSGNIPGLEYTAPKAAGIGAIVCFIYLLILRIILSIVYFLKGFFSKNQ